jgi:hypothetical protein
LQDPADLAAADGDALGLGGSGQGVQGPLGWLVGLLGPVQAERAVGLTLEPARWLASGQRDDPPTLQLSKPPRPARAGKIPQVVEAAGVEAVQPAVDRAGWQPSWAAIWATWAPSQLKVTMRARCSQLAGAWRAAARWRIRRSSVGSAGGRAYSGGNMALPPASQGTQDNQSAILLHRT